MRRSTFAGPLLLILIGAALLAHNIYPTLPLGDYIARFWPYLLIFWGGVRLAEILIWSAQGKPLPARGVVGGEWFLVVFLVLIGTTYHAVHGTTFGWPGRISLGGLEVFGEPFDYPVSGDHAASKTARIVFEDLRGDIRITGSDNDRVTATGHKTVRALDQQGADKADRESPLEIAGDANQLTVRIHSEGIHGPTVNAALEISVPKGASIDYDGRSGSVSVSNVNGSVVLKGRGSDIDLSDLNGPVSISGTYNGMIQAQRLARGMEFKSSKTELSIAKIPGELRLGLGDLTASNVVGPVHLATRSQDVRLTDFTDNIEVAVERGDLDLRPGAGPLGRIQARARSGDIRLSLPSNAQFQMNATTTNGDIENGFGEPLKEEGSGRRQTLRGSVGNGPVIDLATERGDIDLVKTAPGTPAPPLPPIAPKLSEAPRPPAVPRPPQTPLQKLDQ